MGLGWLAAAVVALAPGAAWAEAGDACALMGNDEFTALTGHVAYTDPTPMAFGAGSVCGFDGGQIILFSGDGAMANLEHVWEGFGAARSRTPVPELGPEAYAFFVEAETEYQDHGTFVAFTTGPHAVAVTVYADDGQPADAALPQAVSVAKAVAAKLR
jgi:hypothetical protein